MIALTRMARSIDRPGGPDRCRFHAIIQFLEWRDFVTDQLAGDPAPFFDFHVFACVNRRPDGHPKGSCAAKGSERLRDYMKARAKQLGVPRARINSAGCLDRCEHGPCIVIYPAGVWYRIENERDVDEVIATHLLGGGRVTRLMIDRNAE
jgi:(2Fe-2S) ferredoxin